MGKIKVVIFYLRCRTKNSCIDGGLGYLKLFDHSIKLI